MIMAKNPPIVMSGQQYKELRKILDGSGANIPAGTVVSITINGVTQKVVA
jgi:hypothetical protein